MVLGPPRLIMDHILRSPKIIAHEVHSYVALFVRFTEHTSV
jgi:hypothetical protein